MAFVSFCFLRIRLIYSFHSQTQDRTNSLSETSHETFERDATFSSRNDAAAVWHQAANAGAPLLPVTAPAPPVEPKKGANITVLSPANYGSMVALFNKRDVHNHPHYNAAEDDERTTNSASNRKRKSGNSIFADEDQNKSMRWSQCKLYYRYHDEIKRTTGYTDYDAAVEVDLEVSKLNLSFTQFLQWLRERYGLTRTRKAKAPILSSGN